MRIAIISDIHDHVSNLQAALQQLAELPDQRGRRGADALICCGDLCSPFVVDELVHGFPSGPIYVVFGNNDGDRYRITDKALKSAGTPRIEVRGESAILDLDGRSFFVHHFDDVGRLVAATGQYDVVCYGHNHQCHCQRDEQSSLPVNPGPIMGWHPKAGKVRVTYAVYDTESGEAEIYEVGTNRPVTDWCATKWAPADATPSGR